MGYALALSTMKVCERGGEVLDTACMPKQTINRALQSAKPLALLNEAIRN